MPRNLSKKFYTAHVCVDYMVATIVADRKYEKALLELKRPPQSEGCCAKKPDARDEVDDGIRLTDGTLEEGGVKPAAKSKRCGRSKDEGEELDGEPQMTEEEEMLEEWEREDGTAVAAAALGQRPRIRPS